MNGVEVASLYAKLGADISDFDRGLAKMEKGINAFEQVTIGALRRVGEGIANGIGRAMDVAAEVITSSVDKAVDFESAFTGVVKTVDATESQLAELRKGILDMSAELPTSASDIARIGEAAGQLGIQTESILGFTRVMADLGATTNLGSDEAATQLARFANITQMSQDDFDRLGSSIVALGNNMATTEAEIVSMGMRIAGAGAQVGMSEAQILGMAAALSSVGINAEAGGTAISRVMVDIANEVANGGEKLNALAEVAGMSGSQFADLFRQDAASALQAFIEGLDRISKAGGNVFGVLETLGMDDIRVRDTLLRASGAGELFANAMQISNTAWQENNALTKEAELRYNTTASKFQLFRNAVDAVKIGIGDALLPVLGELTGWATDLVKNIGPSVVAWFGKLGERISRFANKARDWLSGLSNTFSFNFAVIGSENASFSEKVLAIWDMLVQTGLKLFGSLIDMVGAALPGWLDALGEWALVLWEWIKENAPKALDALWKWATGLWDWIVENAPTWAEKLWNWAVETWQWIVDVTPEAVAKLREWGAALWEWLATNWPTWKANLAKWGAAAWEWIAEVTPQAVDTLRLWGAALWDWLTTNWPTWRENLAKWGAAAWQWIVDAASVVGTKLGEWGGALWTWLTTNLPTWRTNLATWAQAAWEWLTTAIPQLLTALGNFGGTLWTWLVTNGPNWIGAFDSWAQAAWAWLETAFGPIAEWLGTIAAEFISWKDIVIGSALALGILFAPAIIGALGAVLAPIAAFVAAWTPVLALFAGAILAVSLLRNAWQRDWGGIRTNTTEAITFLQEAFAPLLTAIEQFGADALSEIVLWATGNQTNFEATKKVWEAAKTTFGTVFDAIMAKLTEWGTMAWDWFQNQFPGAAETLVGAVESVKQTWETFWAAVEPLIQRMKDDFDTYRENWERNSGDITTALGRLQIFIDNAFGIIIEAVTLAINNLIRVMTLIVQFINGDWEGAWRTIKEIAKDTWNTVKNIVDKAVDGILALFGANVEDVQKWIDDVGGKLAAAARKFKDWGRALIEGLKDGVEEKWRSFKSWLDGIWSALTRTFTLKFDVKSPSGVFRDYGINLMQGLAQGIERAHDMVTHALGNVYGEMQTPVALSGVTNTATGAPPATTNTARIEELLVILIQELRNKNMSVNISGNGGENYGALVGFNAGARR